QGFPRPPNVKLVGLTNRPLTCTELHVPPSSTRGREQRPYGCERAEFTLPRRGAAVAAPNEGSAGGRCNRRVTMRSREFGARGRRCGAVRAATSVRRADVKRRCAAFGLPRAAGGCEGAECCTTARAGARCTGRGPQFY